MMQYSHWYVVLLLAIVSLEGKSNAKSSQQNIEDFRKMLLDKFMKYNDIASFPMNRMLNLKNKKCHSIPYKQTISFERCIPKKIANHYCVGMCQSLYVPGHNLQTCNTCKPSEFTIKQVKLHCPMSRGEKTKSISVQMIDTCKCSPCQQ